MRYTSTEGIVERDVNKLKIAALAIIYTVALTTSVFFNANAAHMASTEVITPDDLATPVSPLATQDSWYFYNDNTNTASTAEIPGSYEFVTGAGDPPHGVGSIEFNAGATDRWTIATNQFAGTTLADLGDLTFTTYRPATSADQSLFFNLDIDFDNTTTTGYQGRLVFVPEDNGTVTDDAWQTWDLDAGVWRWSRYASNGNQWLDGDTDELRSWSDIMTAFPNAEVLFETFTGQVVVRAGHPGPVGLNGFLDEVSVADVTYDFEPFEVVATKDACKKGGWMNLTDNEGNSFKNQGDCVSFVATGGKNKADV